MKPAPVRYPERELHSGQLYYTLKAMSKNFAKRATFLKYDADLGVVFGYAIVCTEDGEPYYDLQGDHIPEATMLNAATEFAKEPTIKMMHKGEAVGELSFMFPLTEEIAKAFDIETDKTGLLVGVRPEPDVLEKMQSGELSGFSVGGFIEEAE